MSSVLPTNYAQLIRTQPQLGDRAQLRTDGEGNVGSVTRGGFGRMVGALFRNATDRERNVEAAKSYIAHVRDTQGFEAARFAENALANRIDQGKPVSMRKIREIESRWEADRGQPLELRKDQLHLGERLGGGAQSAVYGAVYDSERGPVAGALKPVTNDSSAGIIVSRDDAFRAAYKQDPASASTQVIERNLATCRLADQLGCRVVAAAYAAETPSGKPAVFMERVHGTEASAIAQPIDSADLRKGLVGLQLIDLLSAQVDRNLSNIMVKNEGGRHIPVAIDHDTSFVTANNAAQLRDIFNRGTAPLTLPTVVDSAMRDRVLAMTNDDLLRIMGPLADAPERRDAAQSRLAEMQQHLQAAPSSSVMVIDPNGWGAPEVADRLTADPGNYWHFLTKAERSAD